MIPKKKGQAGCALLWGQLLGKCWDVLGWVGMEWDGMRWDRQSCDLAVVCAGEDEVDGTLAKKII